METKAILIPAAGAARRMGGADKLLEPDAGGTPLLRRAAEAAVATGARVIVTLPGAGPFLPGRQGALAGLAVDHLIVPDAHEGMAASIRAGASASGSVAGLMVHLPDMPDLTAADLRRLFTAFETDPATPLRAAAEDGTPGHPVIFPRRLFAELAVLTGDTGARRVLAGERVRLVRLRGQRALTDLDTPEDLARWRASGRD